jgi:MFS family permease
VPSNVILDKVGARLWIARITITWGIASGCTALVVGPWSFYLVRFLLGLAEAGFFPGMVLGWAKDVTGSFATGLYALAGFALLSALLTLPNDRQVARAAKLVASAAE